MHPSYKQKTNFVTDKGLYCYRVISFGLKNARVTDQRLVNQMVAKQIGQTMKVYVDDMLVKSVRASNHLADLEVTFSILQKYHMKLNPTKCVFDVGSDKFLWFQELMQYLGSSPLLSKPEEGGPLLLYLAVSTSAVSSALVREVGNKQYPIYYTSKAMVPAKTRYPSIEKLALGLVFSARRLHPYFQAHIIIILTDSPLKQVLRKPDVFGRLTKWAIELREFDIQYRLRIAIKDQAVVDFIAEFTTPNGDPKTEAASATPLVSSPAKDLESEWRWIVYANESSNAKRAGAELSWSRLTLQPSSMSSGSTSGPSITKQNTKLF
ncbi:uncharacterized protein LOC131223467 [Magnolia sinica]|uniref:uncharacterized protein LOC131223467 n=1 Tax=Magnolia sinica TaxID=86752 RepID=UPI002657FD96|nr:uncharacterized protein LOC131223467 [Magnolia sinica]